MSTVRLQSSSKYNINWSSQKIYLKIWIKGIEDAIALDTKPSEEYNGHRHIKSGALPQWMILRDNLGSILPLFASWIHTWSHITEPPRAVQLDKMSWLSGVIEFTKIVFLKEIWDGRKSAEEELKNAIARRIWNIIILMQVFYIAASRERNRQSRTWFIFMLWAVSAFQYGEL